MLALGLFNRPEVLKELSTLKCVTRGSLLYSLDYESRGDVQGKLTSSMADLRSLPLHSLDGQAGDLLYIQPDERVIRRGGCKCRNPVREEAKNLFSPSHPAGSDRYTYTAQRPLHIPSE